MRCFDQINRFPRVRCVFCSCPVPADNHQKISHNKGFNKPKECNAGLISNVIVNYSAGFEILYALTCWMCSFWSPDNRGTDRSCAVDSFHEGTYKQFNYCKASGSTIRAAYRYIICVN